MRMRTKIHLLNNKVLGDIRENLGAKSSTDTSKDHLIERMSARELFNEYLLWNGIIGYTDSILLAVENTNDASGWEDSSKDNFK
jgi:hypothetical protein